MYIVMNGSIHNFIRRITNDLSIGLLIQLPNIKQSITKYK